MRQARRTVKLLKERKRKIKDQFEILSIFWYIVKKNYSRGAKHGRSQEQYGHFKANESTRHAKKKTFSLLRKDFRKTNCTEILSQYLDLVMANASTYTRKERQRYENKYSLGVNGQGPKPGPMKKRADFHKQSTNFLF